MRGREAAEKQKLNKYSRQQKYNSSPHILLYIKQKKMTLITQIEDKGAVVAWSPIGEHADVIALGSKVRIYNNNDI